MQPNNLKRQQWGFGFLGLLTPCILVGLVWFFILSGSTQTQPLAVEASPPQNFGGDSPYLVPAAAFRSDGFLADDYFFSFNGGYVQGNSLGTGCVMAPVYLPEQTFVTDMYVSIYDDNPSRNVNVTFHRVDNYTGTRDILANTSSSGDSPNIVVYSDLSINEPYVEFPDYSYYVTACLPDIETRLYSVRLYYQDFETFLPIVTQ